LWAKWGTGGAMSMPNGAGNNKILEIYEKDKFEQTFKVGACLS